MTLRYYLLLLLWGLTSTLFAQNTTTSQPAEAVPPEDENPVVTETEKAPSKPPGKFTPTEDISEDASTSYPVDI